MEQRDVVDIGEAPSEILPIGVEKIMKQHENEREQMRRMGPLVPIDGVTSVEETTSNALPVPLRRNRYNHSKLKVFDLAVLTMNLKQAYLTPRRQQATVAWSAISRQHNHKLSIHNSSQASNQKHHNAIQNAYHMEQLKPSILRMKSVKPRVTLLIRTT